jgi:hypothetical protein
MYNSWCFVSTTHFSASDAIQLLRSYIYDWYALRSSLQVVSSIASISMSPAFGVRVNGLYSTTIEQVKGLLTVDLIQ